MNLPSQKSPWYHSIPFSLFWPSQITGKPQQLPRTPLTEKVCQYLSLGHLQFISVSNSLWFSPNEHNSLVIITERLWECELSLFSPHEEQAPKQLWHFPLIASHFTYIQFVTCCLSQIPFCIAALHPALLYFISACYSSLPLERNTLYLSTFNHKPLDFIQPSQLPRSFQAPSLFPPHANNVSCVCFSSSKPVCFFLLLLFRSASGWLIYLIRRENGADKDCVSSGSHLAENQIHSLQILPFFWTSLLSGYQCPQRADPQKGLRAAGPQEAQGCSSSLHSPTPLLRWKDQKENIGFNGNVRLILYSLLYSLKVIYDSLITHQFQEPL